MQRCLTAFLITLAIALAPGESRAATKILLLDSNIINYLPVYVGIDQGIFARHGLDLERKTIPNASYTTAALFSGTADIGTLSPFPLVQATDAGLDLVVIATSDVLPSPVRTGVLVAENSAIKTAQDLVGKKVGVAGLNGAFHILTRKWLSDNGVDYSKVSFVEISFAQMSDALKSGQIDAVASTDPFFGRIVDAHVGHPIVDLNASAPKGTAVAFYAVSRPWAAQHAEAIADFRAAMEEAVTFIQRDPGRAREILAQFTKLPAQVTASAPMPDFVLKASQTQVDYYAAIARAQGLIDKGASVANIVLP